MPLSDNVAALATRIAQEIKALRTELAPKVKPFPPVNLTDAATIALNAAQGTHFRIATTAARTLGIPSNPTDGQVITVEHTVSGGTARLLTLTTGLAGSFKYGTDITALTATTSGTTDLIQFCYSSSAGRWWVIGYVKGY